MRTTKNLLVKYVVAFIAVTGFHCAAAVVPIFVPLIAAKEWANTKKSDNTFFFLVDELNKNTSTFSGNENLTENGPQDHFVGSFTNHDIYFIYDNDASGNKAGKTYKGTVNDASNTITLNGTDANDPLPALTLTTQ